jgi:hypothetical protein
MEVRDRQRQSTLCRGLELAPQGYCRCSSCSYRVGRKRFDLVSCPKSWTKGYGDGNTVHAQRHKLVPDL